jgi:hypothetical protein
MSLDATSKLANTLAKTANETNDIKQNLSPDDEGAQLQAQFSEPVVADGTLGVTAIRRDYESDSFILDHISQGILDSRYTDSIGLDYGALSVYYPTNENPTNYVVTDKSPAAKNATYSIFTTAYYPFNGNANDESLNAYNGTVANATLTTDHTGNLNNAYSFNGTSAKITLSSFGWTATQSFTYSAWIKQSAYDGGPILENNIQWKINSAGKLYPQWNNGSWQVGTVTTATVPLNAWTHVAMTYDGTTLKTYINGVLDVVTNSTSSTTPTRTGTTPIIGNDGGSEWFAGAISEIFVSNEAFNDTEITSLFNISGGKNLFKAKGYYSFTGNANDSSAWALHGTANSVTLTTDHLGNANNAYLFNGSSSNIAIPAPGFTAGQEKSLWCWFKLGADGVNTSDSQPLVVADYFYLHIRNAGNSVTARYDYTSAVTAGYALGTGDRSWHLAVGTFKWTGSAYEVRVYVDGVDRVSTSNSNIPTSVYTNYGIGRRSSTYFNGTISEAGVVPYCMTATEVTSLYNRTLVSKLDVDTVVHKLDKPLVTKKDTLNNTITGYELFTGGPTVPSGFKMALVTNPGSVFTPKNQEPWTMYVEVLRNHGLGRADYRLIGWYGGNYLGPYLAYSGGSITGAIGQGTTTGSSSNYNFSVTGTFTDGQIQRILYMYDGTYIDVYVNGTRYYHYNIGAFVDNGPGSQVFKVGANPWDYYVGFTGIVSEPMLWNRALSTTEIATLYNISFITNPDISDGWLKLDGGYLPGSETFPLTFPFTLGDGGEILYNIDI